MILRTAPWLQATAALPGGGRCVGVQLDDEGVWLFREDRPSRMVELFLSLADLKATLGKGRAVALGVRREGFDRLLRQAVDTTHDPERFPVRQAWRLATRYARVRIRWVPARDPSGAPLDRETARLTVMPDVARELADRWVLQERPVVDLLPRLDEAAPIEAPYPLGDEDLRRALLGEEAG